MPSLVIRVFILTVSLVAMGCGDQSGSPTDGATATNGNASPSEGDFEQVSAHFDGSGNGDFYDFPWPSDARLLPGGQPDLHDFPNPYGIEMLQLYIDTAESSIVGFGNNSPAFFHFDGPIQVENLPKTIGDGADELSPVLIVDLTMGASTYGDRIPANAFFFEEETAYYPANVLAVAPHWGFPLGARKTYGAVVLSTLGDSTGEALVQPELLSQVLDGTAPTSGYGDLNALYGPLVDVLPILGIEPSQVAAATVFTTQDSVGEMEVIRNFLLNEQTPSLSDIYHVPQFPQVESIGAEEAYYDRRYENDEYGRRASEQAYYLFEGRYESPNFQSGEPPFMEEGGAILFDEQGLPIVQYTESLRFALTVPKGVMPPGGWPLVLYAHGTGGDYKSFMYSSGNAPADVMTERGVAMMSIDEPLHGPRSPAGTDEALASFNFLNPDAARGNFRQAAIDVFWELRVAREVLSIAEGISPTGQDIEFNRERMAFMGHSHGGLSGALLMPFEENFRGVMLSGAGGGLSLTILERKDYVDFEELMRVLLNMGEDEQLNSFHPAMSLVQTLVDITDPINYAPHFVYDPLPGHTPRHYLQSEGFFDLATPPITIEAMVVAGKIPLIAPAGRYLPGHEYLGLDPVEGPVLNNVSSSGGSATAALAQFPQWDHWAVFRDGDASALVGDFLRSATSEPEAVSIEWANAQR